MSSSGSMSGINKIHINSSTKMTLSDRFTAFSAKPKIQPRTSSRGIESPVSRAASIANRRLLKQLAQKHTREAALKLKRRSMKPKVQTAAFSRVTNGIQIKRGTIKALRLGPSGRLMKANSITNVATMEADFMGRTPRRSNSTSRIAERIGGGGAARRAGRPVWRPNTQANYERTPPPRAARSRSRSRTRRISALLPPSSAQAAGIGQRMARPRRSNSRPRVLNRSRSRSRADRMLKMMDKRNADAVPITSRLGIRPTIRPNRARSASRGRTINTRQGIASGRIQKRRASVKATLAGGASLASNVRNRISRPNGRPNPTRGRARSRSRTGGRFPPKTNNGVVRGGAANRQRGGGGVQRGSRGATRGVAARGGRRGRSQQRGGGAQQRNGSGVQTQQVRGRSRSRGRRISRGGRQIGKPRPEVKKEDLDKELDQYMSSTKNADI